MMYGEKVIHEELQVAPIIVTEEQPTVREIVDVHTIINEAMDKKDRFVHIFIMGDNISVDVKPLSESDPRWIVREKKGYGRVRHQFECSECRVWSDNITPYCSFCGEKLRMPVIEDMRVEKTPDGPVECLDDDSPKEVMGDE